MRKTKEHVNSTSNARSDDLGHQRSWICVPNKRTTVKKMVSPFHTLVLIKRWLIQSVTAGGICGHVEVRELPLKDPREAALAAADEATEVPDRVR